jgi:mycothiol synthase
LRTVPDPTSTLAGNDLDIPSADLPAGFRAREIDPQADVEPVVELCVAAAVAEYGTSDMTIEMVRESYNAPTFNPKTDGRLVLDTDGQPAGVVEFYSIDAAHVAPYVYVRVRPDLLETGVGEALLGWVERRGREGLHLAEPGLRVSLHAQAAGVNEPMQRIFEHSGWAMERVFWQMEIELGDEAPATAPLADGIAIRSAVAGEDERAVMAAQDEAFADHYGFVPRAFDEWLTVETKVLAYDPSLWFLGVDGDEIAGISLCLPEAPGRPDTGWVSILGVRPAWRGKGLGLALLTHSFAEFHRRGKRTVGLGVDSESLTGATRLYERAGMRVTRDGRSYERVIREGREIRPT